MSNAEWEDKPWEDMDSLEGAAIDGLDDDFSDDEDCCSHCGKPFYEWGDPGCGYCDRRSPDWGIMP